MKQILQILKALFFWLVVIFPFAFVGIFLFIPQYTKIVEDIMINIFWFFLVWAIILGTGSLILTLLNNWQIKRQPNRYVNYNLKGVQLKKQVLNDYFEHKFGKNIRDLDYYSVAKDNNIPLGEFMKLYRKHRIDRRDGH